MRKQHEQPPSLLHHYTSAEGLLGITRSREIWATNVLYLNDATELSDAIEVLDSQLESTPLKLRENAEFFSRAIPNYSKDIPLDHFVTSFCEEGDLLGQWREYGASGTGYSIGFYSSALLSAAKRKENTLRGGCALRKVKYKADLKREMIQKRIAVLNEILGPVADELEPTYDEEYRRLVRLWHQIAASLHPTLALMKHVAFEGEQEWRLVRTLWKKPVPTAGWPVLVRTVRGRLVPYVPISWVLPNTPDSPEVRGIKEVRCGPSADPELKEKVVRDLLATQNCWNAQVFRSEVPLRV